MIFLTKKQVEEIAQQIASISVKDTDFDQTEFIQYDDLVAIVQNGVNKTINIETLREGIAHDGLSAYELAVQEGYTGTLEQWLNDLVGLSAYELAVRNGYVGTLAQWLKSLEGLSAYQLAVRNGYSGTEAQWLASLIGLSAYQVAVKNGYSGTEAQWLASLKGETGPAGVTSATATVNNTTGTPGVSVSLNNGVLGFTFSNLKGQKGDTGAAGVTSASATVSNTTGTPGVTVSLNNGALSFAFSNLKGATGSQGATGPAGVTSATASVSNTTGTPGVTVSLNNGVLNFAFSGLKGETASDAVLYVTQSLNASQKLQARNNIDVHNVQTSAPSGGMVPNICYNLGSISGSHTISFAAAQTGEYAHYYFTFSTGSSAPTITWPSAITSWAKGAAPVINSNAYYEVSVLNGVGVYLEKA